MGNLLSLYPKIHRLGAYTQKDRCLPHGQRNLFGKREGDFPNRAAGMSGEAFDIHTRLYELLCFLANEQEDMDTYLVIGGWFATAAQTEQCLEWRYG
jgi:hypothetical protein